MDELFIVLPHVIIFALGAAVGSFLNVVIYRLPAGLSVLHPPSRCPNCHRRLKSYDNVPVFGWLWLRGKCRFCKWPIPSRYPLIEALTGLLFLIPFWVLGLTWPMVGCWILFSWLLALSMIDFDTMTLPNVLTSSGLVVGLGFQVWLGLQQPAPIASAASYLMGGIVGMVLGIWLLDIITVVGLVLLGQAAMGGGDAKLAAMMGVWLGWKLFLVAGFLACALGAFVGGGAIALGLWQRRQPMPFGPFLALGTAIAALWGTALIQQYLQIFFPTL